MRHQTFIASDSKIQLQVGGNHELFEERRESLGAFKKMSEVKFSGFHHVFVLNF